MGISTTLSAHVSRAGFDSVPPAAIEAAKLSLLDAIGVSVAASTLADECLPFVELAREQPLERGCTVLGFGDRVSAPAAAFANGALAHALDFEDAHDEALVHPNAPVVPVLLALADAYGPVSGRDFLAAMAIGCDLTCRLSLATGRTLAERGWYPPSLLAGLGAAAAAARLLGLDGRGVLDALSLALGQLGSHGELVNSPDSVVRSVRDAFPAQAALVSALLARGGVRGFDRPFEGPAGFFAVYAGGEVDESTLLEKLGTAYAGAAISFKPWPSCRGTHAFVEGALELVRAHGLRAGEIERVQLVGSPVVGSIVAEPRSRKLTPQTLIDAKFSVYYTAALAFRDGEVGLDSFVADRLHDPELLALAQRMWFEPDGRCDVAAGTVEVVAHDGRVLTHRVAATYGSPAAPIAPGDLLAKFLDCTRHAAAPAPEEAWRRLAAQIVQLEQVADVAAALAPLAAAERASYR